MLLSFNRYSSFYMIFLHFLNLDYIFIGNICIFYTYHNVDKIRACCLIAANEM